MSEVVEPAAAPEFDADRLDAYLRERIPGLGGPMRVDRISGGQSNPTFFISYPERRLVLRKQPPGPLLPSAHAVDREYRVLTALRGTGVPVPETVLFCDDRSVAGTPFYIMERLDGRVFEDASLPGIAPEERGEMYRSLAQTLAALHNVDPMAIGLGDFGKPTDYFARQIARWGRQWEMSRTRDNPTVEGLREWLAANIPPEQATSIVHGDYRVGNVMFHPIEPRVIAILDWELSTLGHPLADLAHSCIAWHSRPGEYGGLLGLDLAKLGIPERPEYEQAYYDAAVHPFRLATFHMAFVLFRFALIFEGIAARARAGSAAAANAADVGYLSGVFSQHAADLVWP
jgi:aminoglycoside phosphotransferase (APT) family kinase protein